MLLNLKSNYYLASRDSLQLRLKRGWVGGAHAGNTFLFQRGNPLSNFTLMSRLKRWEVAPSVSDKVRLNGDYYRNVFC